jgi:hypothetical protein
MNKYFLLVSVAALLFVGCGNQIEPFTPVEVENEVLLIKWKYDYGVTTPATAEIRIINSVADYLPIETEFMIGDAITDTLKTPITEIDFATQQIVAVISERIVHYPFSIKLDTVIEYENHIEISVWKAEGATVSTGRSIMLILMSKTSKTVTAKYNDWSGTDW